MSAENASGGSGMDPMHQFEIKRIIELNLGGLDVSITNSSVMMMAAVGLISLFLIMSMSGRAIIPGRWQSIAELSYEFVGGMMRDTIGDGGQKFFPLIFSLFTFILTLNMLGLMPYFFTSTSHIIFTLGLAMLVFFVVLITGFVKNGIGYLKLFAPSGVPMALMPLMIVIELISYLTRPLSLSVRLFANMLAGHTMLKVFAGFVIMLGPVFGIIPEIVIVALTGLEFLVAFLQAYVFAVLTCIYLNDSLHMHH